MTDKTPRVSITHGSDNLTITRGDEKATLPYSLVFADEAVMDRLAKEGLAAYLRKVTAEVESEQRLAAMEEAFEKLVDGGIDVLTPKRQPRGPLKADKVAALAFIKGVTVGSIEDALSLKDKAEQDEILNDPEVLEQVERLQAGSVAL